MLKYKVYVYVVKHNYILGGMLFTIRKAQLHVSTLNDGHHVAVFDDIHIHLIV